MEIPETGVIEIRAYYTWMGEDGFARTVAKKGICVTLEDAVENTRVVTSFPGNHQFPIIIDSTQIKSMTKEARDHFSLNKRDSRTNAFAIIVNSPISRVIANFFMGLNKPQVPVKLFNSEEAAIKWCKKISNVE